jgi:hypothetical protein
LLPLADYIIYVDVDVAANLAREAFLHAQLIGGSSIPEAKGHGSVAEAFERCYESRFLLIFLCHRDLVVSVICVQIAGGSEPVVESMIWLIHGRTNSSFGQAELRLV